MVDRVNRHIARLFFAQPRHEFRVINGVKRINAVISNSRFEIFFFNGYHRKAVGFRAGAVGQVNGHDGRGFRRGELEFIQFFGGFAGVF